MWQAIESADMLLSMPYDFLRNNNTTASAAAATTTTTITTATTTAITTTPLCRASIECEGSY